MMMTRALNQLILIFMARNLALGDHFNPGHKTNNGSSNDLMMTLNSILEKPLNNFGI